MEDQKLANTVPPGTIINQDAKVTNETYPPGVVPVLGLIDKRLMPSFTYTHEPGWTNTFTKNLSAIEFDSASIDVGLPGA